MKRLAAAGLILLLLALVAALLHQPARERLAELPPVASAIERYRQLKERLDQAEYAACLVRLDALDIAHSQVSNRPEMANGCSIQYAVRVDRIGKARLGSPATMTCDLASRLGEWMVEEVQPAAAALLASPVTRIDHFGTYACRTVSGRRTLSQHAFANAIDVSGLRLADGTRITIARDWDGAGARAAFAQRIGRQACGIFQLALTPNYNASHSDHFHLDAGPYRLCGY